jgi:hypothetical protein
MLTQAATPPDSFPPPRLSAAYEEMTVPDRSNQKQTRPGSKPPSPEAEAQAVRDKTARLRALRLARDAELAANAPPAPPKRAASKKKPARSGEKGPSLSDWLSTQQTEGRRN